MSTPWVIAFLSLWALVLIEGTLLLGMLRRVSVVLEAAEIRLRELPALGPRGLPIGARVPPFAASAVDGTPFSEADLRNHTSLVLFLSSGCRPCQTLADELNKDDDLHGAGLLVVLHDPSERLELGLADALPIVYQRDGAISRAFETTATPHAFVVDRQCIVTASGTPNSVTALRRLIDESTKGGDRLAEWTR